MRKSTLNFWIWPDSSKPFVIVWPDMESLNRIHILPHLRRIRWPLAFCVTYYVDIVIVSWKYNFLLIARKKNKQQAPMGNSVFRSVRCWSVARQNFPTLHRYTFFCYVEIYFSVRIKYFIYCLQKLFRHDSYTTF